MGAGDHLEQLLGREALLHVDLVPGVPEALEPAVGDLLGDKDAHRPILPARSAHRPTDPGAAGFPACRARHPDARSSQDGAGSNPSTSP